MSDDAKTELDHVQDTLTQLKAPSDEGAEEA